MIGNNGGDRLYDNGAGNQTLIGGAGNDALISRYGSETLTGGAGNNDFDIGNTIKNDTITDFGHAGSDNFLNIASFINAGENPILTDSGSNVVVSFSGSASTITLLDIQANDLVKVSGGFDNLGSTASGTTTSASPVAGTEYSSVSTTLSASESTLVLTGTSALDGTASIVSGTTVIGNNGGDRLYDNGAGNQTLIGGAGNDALISRYGSETLTGGAGNNDFDIGNTIKNDTITDFAATGTHNILNISSFLDAGLTPTLTNSGDNLVITFSGSASTVTLLGVHASELTPTSYGFTH